MDDVAALKMVNDFVTLLEAALNEYTMPPLRMSVLSRTSILPPPQKPEYNGLEIGIKSSLPAITAIAREVDPALAERIGGQSSPGWPYARCLTASRELAGMLAMRPKLDLVLRGPGPKLDATLLHPWVWEAAQQLWADRYYPEAVRAAASRLFDHELAKKLGVPKGKSGIGEAFSKNAPTPDSPRLRFHGLIEGTEDWRNAVEGARFFGMGCEAGIRNLVTHGSRRPDKQTALEMLAALSVVARWIDEAEVYVAIVDD